MGTNIDPCCAYCRINTAWVNCRETQNGSNPSECVFTSCRYYSNPEVFNPDNFSKEAKAKRHPYAFLGFGHGPRSCLGMRFALLEAKFGLAAIFARFNLKTSDKTPMTLTMDPGSAFSASIEPLLLKVETRANLLNTCSI